MNTCHSCGFMEPIHGAECPYREHLVAPTVESEIGRATWASEKPHLHLTIDGLGLVSLWDEERPREAAYLKLELTPEQAKLIQATMLKGGFTP